METIKSINRKWWDRMEAEKEKTGSIPDWWDGMGGDVCVNAYNEIDAMLAKYAEVLETTKQE